MKSIQKFLLIMAGFFLAIPQSFSQADVQSLVGARGGGDAVMTQKGYTHVKTDKSNSSAYAYWWQQKTSTCVCVRTTDGKIQSIVKSRPVDCNKGSGANTKYNHSASSHAEGKHYDDVDREKAFERGYNEAKMNESYNNVYEGDRMVEAYARGYTSGVKVRNSAPSYKPNNSYVEIHDLNGWLASSAYDVLGKRGFKELRSKTFNGGTHKYWHHSRTGQCIESVQRGRDISEIRQYKNCNEFLGNVKEEPSFIDWKDQIGKDANSAYSNLERRGFKEVKIAHTGGTTRRLFHHNKTGQCIVTISVNERIKDIEPSDNCNKHL